MASLVGHALAALTAYHGCQRVWPARLPDRPWNYLLPLALAVAADLDILAYLTFGASFGGVHRGYSHSLIVGFGFACLLALPFSLRGRWFFATTLLTLGLTAAMHPLLDLAMARGPRLPLFWPLSREMYLSSVQVVPTAYFSRTWQGLKGVVLDPTSLQGMGLELLEFLPLWWAVKARTWPMRALALVLTVAGFGLVVVLYR